jgi:hypothetical protein
MKIVTKKIISYLKAGCLLHMITALEILFFCLLFYFADISSWLTNDYIFFKLIVLSPMIGLPLFAQLDARSRYQNYKLLKDNLFVYGFQKRIVKPFIKSRCQRDAVKAAAYELGMAHQCKEYFKINGYKWYHLAPDVIFKNPYLLLTKKFWVTTLFTKAYHSKIDFRKQFFISMQQQASPSITEC